MQSFLSGGHFFGVFFGQMWGNLGKILRTPQNLPAPVLLYLCFITILFNWKKRPN